MKKNQIVNATLIFTISMLFLFFISSEKKSEKNLQLYDIFDTYCEIAIYSGKNADKALSECSQYLLQKEKQWSATEPESEISLLNSAAGKESVSLSADTIDIIDKALSASQYTCGYFDITIGAISNLWNFENNPAVPSDSEISDSIHKTGYKFLELDKTTNTAYLSKDGASVTLGAIAKGYATDELVKILKKENIHSALINFGGNVYCLGALQNGEKRRVGIADPLDRNNLLCSVTAYNTAVVTSGNYERFFEMDGIKYHHILDPFTGMPANNGLNSVTIISPDCTLADILSTACFVIGFNKSLPLIKEMGVSAIFATNDTVYYSSELKGSIRFDNTRYEYKEIT